MNEWKRNSAEWVHLFEHVAAEERRRQGRHRRHEGLAAFAAVLPAARVLERLRFHQRQTWGRMPNSVTRKGQENDKKETANVPTSNSNSSSVDLAAMASEVVARPALRPSFIATSARIFFHFRLSIRQRASLARRNEAFTKFPRPSLSWRLAWQLKKLSTHRWTWLTCDDTNFHTWPVAWYQWTQLAKELYAFRYSRFRIF